jgi:hypothetical protein
MMQSVPADDARVVAVRAALGPFAWRSFTAAAVCRRAVAAMDAARAFPHRSGLVVPHHSPDECVEALIEVLDSRRWQSYTIEGLSRILVAAALAWQHEQAWFDIRLGLLLDGIG